MNRHALAVAPWQPLQLGELANYYTVMVFVLRAVFYLFLVVLTKHLASAALVHSHNINNGMQNAE